MEWLLRRSIKGIVGWEVAKAMSGEDDGTGEMWCV